MDLSKNINNSFNDVQPADGGNQKKLIDKTYVMMDVYTFQNKILSGEISDDKGTAELFINGAPSNYNIYIDRKCITKSDGTLITYSGMLKLYEPEQLQIKYTKKKKRVMNMKQYREMMKQRGNNLN